ncbi:MAG: gluconokinase [Phycisphaeraceae bacterium]|nr:gluconokinase [Phycisphaeraceae bacterium]
MILVLMGVSGSGKSAVGEKLSSALGWPLVEGDTFHPPANIRKMSAGTPLTDEDRWPWLDALRRRMDEAVAHHQSLIVTCSALKRAYRLRLGLARSQIRVIYLHGPEAVLRQRIEDRHGHFMRANMLASQVATLEPPAADEAIAVDVTPPLDAVFASVRQALAL